MGGGFFMREVYVFEDLVNTLIELEKKGFDFYENYKNRTEDGDLKSLFGELATAEKKHEAFYKSLKERLMNTQVDIVGDEYKEYIDAMIKNSFFIAKSEINVGSIKEAIDVAERLEKDTIIFMNELSGLIDDKIGFKMILEEEKKHLYRIYQYKKDHGIE